MRNEIRFTWLIICVLTAVTSTHAGVVIKENSPIPWAQWSQGIQNPWCTGGFGCFEASGGSGVYFGYTSDPSFASQRDFIPYKPKFPNIVIAADAWYLTTIPEFPREIVGAEYYDPESPWEADVTLPIGTTLTFLEGDLSGHYQYSTLYRYVDGVPTPIEEFRPLIGDGPDYFTLDTLETIDLVVFGFYTGGIYPDPGWPVFPLLFHINVVPEPGILSLWFGVLPVLLKRKR